MTAYVFRNLLVTKSIGAGVFGLGYLRFTFVPLDRWAKSADYRGAGLRGWMDNYGPLWQGWAFKGCKAGGEWLSFRLYRRVATHFSVGPFTFSYVRDREKMGPCGPIWPRRTYGRAA